MIPFTARGRTQCSMICSTTDGMTLVCGAPVKPGTSWCGLHYAVVFQPAKSVRRSESWLKVPPAEEE